MNSDTPFPASTNSAIQPPRPNSTAWFSVSALAVAAISLFGGFFVALAAVILGHVARRREPGGRSVATLALVIAYVSAVGHGLFFAVAAFIAASFANSDWQF